MSNADLHKLKISDEKRTRKPVVLPWLVLCLLSMIVGYLAGNFYKIPFRRPIPVKMMVVMPLTTGEAKQFTVGGWIEVAAPEYPKIVSARVSERIEKLHVQEGDIVEPGQLLVEMYDRDLKTRAETTAASLAAVRESLRLMENGYRKEDIAQAAAKVNEAEEKLRIATANYGRIKDSVMGMGITERELDNALADKNMAAASLAGSKHEYEKMRSGFRKEEIDAERAKLDSATKEYELLKRQVEYCKVTAPAEGRRFRVLQVKRKVGEQINMEKMNSDLIYLYDPDDIQARVDVPQMNIRHVSPGAEVAVTTEAAPGKEYKGRVLRLEPLADLAKNTITVKIKIDNPDMMLFPEMIARASFFEGKRTNSKSSMLMVPKTALITKEGLEGVYVAMDGIARFVPVQKDDLLAGTDVVGVKGINSGQRVIISELNRVHDGQAIREEQ